MSNIDCEITLFRHCSEYSTLLHILLAHIVRRCSDYSFIRIISSLVQRLTAAPVRLHLPLPPHVPLTFKRYVLLTHAQLVSLVWEVTLFIRIQVVSLHTLLLTFRRQVGHSLSLLSSPSLYPSPSIYHSFSLCLALPMSFSLLPSLSIRIHK